MRFANFNSQRILPSPLKKGAVCPFCNEEVIAKCGLIKDWHWAHKCLDKCDDWFEGESKWHLDWKKNFPLTHQEVIIEKNYCALCNPLKIFNPDYYADNCPHYKTYVDDCLKNGELPTPKKRHIADIQCSHGMVIELQHSPLSSEEIKKREDFYKNMIWILDGNTFGKNLYIKKKGDFHTFTWKWFPRSWEAADKLIYIDMQADADNYFKWMIESKEEGEYYDEEKDEYCKGKNWYLERYNEFNNKLFLIRKIYTGGRVGGWGQLLDKDKFIKYVWGDK